MLRSGDNVVSKHDNRTFWPGLLCVLLVISAQRGVGVTCPPPMPSPIFHCTLATLLEVSGRKLCQATGKHGKRETGTETENWERSSDIRLPSVLEHCVQASLLSVESHVVEPIILCCYFVPIPRCLVIMY